MAIKKGLIRGANQHSFVPLLAITGLVKNYNNLNKAYRNF
jgi:hypothetical protein